MLVLPLEGKAILKCNKYHLPSHPGRHAIHLTVTLIKYEHSSPGNKGGGQGTLHNSGPSSPRGSLAGE